MPKIRDGAGNANPIGPGLMIVSASKVSTRPGVRPCTPSAPTPGTYLVSEVTEQSAAGGLDRFEPGGHPVERHRERVEILTEAW